MRRDLRGRGLGRTLFDRALERAAGRVVGLDGVLAQQDSYERWGFELAHRNIRWRTRGGGDRSTGLAELSSVPFEEILGYDTSVFGSERARFLRTWTDRPPGRALACIRGGVLAGYGVVRECGVGAKVGPLFADDEEVADALLTGLIAAAGPAADVFIDMPAANPRTMQLRTARTMEPVFETVRMYRGGRPPEDVERVFGVTTFEFG